jgi:hypothetical protein
LRLLIHATVSDAARTLGVSEETIDGLLDRWSARTVAWGAGERLGLIGLDAIALKRGHRACVVWVTTPLAGGGVEILAVLADRTQETVVACLRAIRAEVPWAESLSDRCHGARAARDCADTVRTQESARRTRALPTAA